MYNNNQFVGVSFPYFHLLLLGAYSELKGTKFTVCVVGGGFFFSLETGNPALFEVLGTLAESHF